MVGQNIGKYRVQDRIGRGGMGTVYRAVDETLHREVAIKVLNAELNDPEIAKRFRAEAITVARLSHPGIATIYELFQHDGQWLMVMEFVRGETLEQLVTRMGQLSPQRAAEVCMHALAALAHAHSMGVVHRDLKPANLMITETGAVKVMDFGIARVAGTEHLTNAGFMMGTPAYMAPEQVRGGEVDARADLYAIGVVFYRLTTGTLPFKGETPFAIVQSQVYDPPTPVGLLRSDLPPWVEPVISRALAKAPEGRFQSAAEFHDALARSLAGLPIGTLYGASPAEPLATPPRPMPTGTFAPPAAASGVVPRPIGATPVGTPIRPPIEASGTFDPDATMVAPGAKPTLAIPDSDAPTVLTPSSIPVTGLTGARGDAPVASSNRGLLIGAAVIVVAGIIGGALWLRGPRETPSTEPAAPAAESTPVQVQADANASAGATRGEGASPAAAPAPRARTGAAPASAPARGTTAPPEAPKAPTPPAAAPATPPARAADDALVTFNDVKLYVVNGTKTNDRDVIVNFASGQIAIMPKSGGTAIVTIPYRRVAKATYVKARDPKWDPTLAAPPEKLDVGSFMRQSRHWLVIQTRDTFEILRLEDKNIVQVLDTLETRTGMRVDRPRSDDQ